MTSSSNTNPFFNHNDAKPEDVGLQPEVRNPSSRSSDSVDVQSTGLESSSSRLYHIYHSAIRYDYRVSDADKNHLYFVNNSQLTRHKADITVHAGEDSKAPVAGVCKFLHLSRHFKVGLGDPQQSAAMVWEDLESQSLRMNKFRWPMSVPSVSGGFDRRWFIWKRTKHLGVDGESPLLFSLHNYKLVDELSGQVVAVFASSSFTSLRKNGKLQVTGEYGPNFDLMALITLLAIYEKSRRKRAKAAGAGANGGS